MLKTSNDFWIAVIIVIIVMIGSIVASFAIEAILAEDIIIREKKEPKAPEEIELICERTGEKYTCKVKK